ncbi:MAG TPA: hypothetical protein PLQ50_02520 [Candidatus Woesebacteria bacterium]|nr:hypothetical protein [Candidatus Woesebacteria bacterium]
MADVTDVVGVTDVADVVGVEAATFDAIGAETADWCLWLVLLVLICWFPKLEDGTLEATLAFFLPSLSAAKRVDKLLKNDMITFRLGKNKLKCV